MQISLIRQSKRAGNAMTMKKSRKVIISNKGRTKNLHRINLSGASGHFRQAILVEPGVWRETYLKPLYYILIVLTILTFFYFIAKQMIIDQSEAWDSLLFWIYIAAGIGFLLLLTQQSLVEYIFPSRFWLDSHHFLISAFVILSGLGVFGITCKSDLSLTKSLKCFSKGLTLSLIVVLVTGFLMLLRLPGLGLITRHAYTLFDLGLIGILIGVITHLFCLENKNVSNNEQK